MQTLQEAVNQYLDYLRDIGKRPGTVATYGKDFELAIKHFGADKKLDAFLPPHIAEFFKSDLVNKLPNGKDRAQPTILKTKRAVRMMFVWAHNSGMIDKLPIPKAEMPKHTQKKVAPEVVVEETKHESA